MSGKKEKETEAVSEVETPVSTEKKFKVKLKPAGAFPKKGGEYVTTLHIRGGYEFTNDKPEHIVSQAELQKFYIEIPLKRKDSKEPSRVFDSFLTFEEIV